jgi:hypothetical protein
MRVLIPSLCNPPNYERVSEVEIMTFDWLARTTASHSILRQAFAAVVHPTNDNYPLCSSIFSTAF